jgi:eukaryotic-like serine/threonine-protein kinase
VDAATDDTQAGALSPGTIVSDRYKIISLLGEGGMGAVYRAEHVHMKKAYALKVLLSDLAKQPEIVARFEREAIAAGNIEHPNVVAATDFGRLPDGAFFLVMELVAGRGLRDELAKGPIEPARALPIIRGVISAVEAAHAKNIVHRDLKPENVMLVARDDDADFPKVLDFGIAKMDVSFASSGSTDAPAPGGAVLTRMGMIMGTPEYMAPEQALGQEVDARADLYALGVILYEMLAGKPPFHGEPLMVMRAQVMNDAPPLPDAITQALPGIAGVMARALSKEPGTRFQTAQELRAALEDLSIPFAAPSAPDLDRPTMNASPQALARAATSAGEPVDAIGPTSAYAAVVVPPAASAGAFQLKRWHIAAAVGTTLIGFLLVTLLFVRAGSSRDGSTARAVAAPTEKSSPDETAPPADPSAAASAAASATAATEPATAPADSSDIVDLDDEPAPSASATAATPRRKAAANPRTLKKPATRKPAAKPRRTGPGGIYVPPPSKWFK